MENKPGRTDPRHAQRSKDFPWRVQLVRPGLFSTLNHNFSSRPPAMFLVYRAAFVFPSDYVHIILIATVSLLRPAPCNRRSKNDRTDQDCSECEQPVHSIILSIQGFQKVSEVQPGFRALNHTSHHVRARADSPDSTEFRVAKVLHGCPRSAGGRF